MKHYTDWDDFMIHKRKFSDSDFSEYYHRGLSDTPSQRFLIVNRPVLESEE